MKKIEHELQSLISSAQASVVTVVSSFPQEHSTADGGILGFLKSEVTGSDAYMNVGSGIIFSELGYVLTRSSIVLGAESNTVRLFDDREFSAEFRGHDPETGFAILKIEGADLVPAKLGHSAEVLLGSWSLVIGNSYRVFPSVVFGSVNGFTDDGLIQVSADLNPGSNGSPIFNMQGAVIGILAGQRNAREGVALARDNPVHYLNLVYPIDWIAKIATDLIQFGKVRKGWLGVVGYHDEWKAKIREIKRDSPAHQAGLLEGDVIVKYSSTHIKSIAELVRLVEFTSPGKEVQLGYMRKGTVRYASVQIGEKVARKRVAAPKANQGKTPSMQYQPNPDRKLILDLITVNQQLENRVLHLEKELQHLKTLVENEQ